MQWQPLNVIQRNSIGFNYSRWNRIRTRGELLPRHGD